MSILYKLVRVNDNITHNPKPRYLAAVKPRGTIDTEMIKEHINANATFTQADVQGVIDSLVYEIVLHLEQGFTVKIDGLGTFGITAYMAKELNDPDYVAPGTIKMKSIYFRPAPKLKRKLEDVLFEKIVEKKNP